MKNLLFLLLLCTVLPGWAQTQLKGYVKNIEKDEAVPLVFIKNERTGQTLTGAQNGYFQIEAAPKDKIVFSRLGIKKKTIIVSEAMLQGTQGIYVDFASDELEEVDVSGLSTYQKDSMKRYELYKPTLTRKKDKLKVFVSPLGIGFKNIFSSWMQYVAPKTKRKLKFKKTFARWEAEKYVESVYTTALVNDITGLSGEELAVFMNTYPMPATFAHESSDLERKSWIKANFEDWKGKGKPLLIK
ncbi:hypothetical protein DBR32_04545 [Taibaiella sp. KBW10]|uniref:hypothetical protein n=1 Tax=Taibaiella sp. KBW10 TaxID=2153357 RepID=UPI000F5B582C|nr:hypothetical protein [Taibaiella sp. KBW10]RQO31244.1 hypothetical protein DBR32_04545 [Taibaiella sp. KBW10]